MREEIGILASPLAERLRVLMASVCAVAVEVGRLDVKGEMMRCKVGKPVAAIGVFVCGFVVVDFVAVAVFVLPEAFFIAPHALSLPSASFSAFVSLPWPTPSGANLAQS